jgi:ElaB/YqjD/DUF883 family membrane-anchored ribosome-binding protein
MNKHEKSDGNELGALAADARALMSATAEVAGEKVGQARRCLADALKNAKERCYRSREQAAEIARVANEAVREHPFHALGVAFGVGALVGFLALRRRTRDGD